MSKGKARQALVLKVRQLKALKDRKPLLNIHPFSFTFLSYVYDFLKILSFYKMYILLLIFMVKPIKLYTSVFVANSIHNGQ